MTTEKTTPRADRSAEPTAAGATPIAASEFREPSHRLSLLVIGERLVTSVPLPESGEVVLGRSSRCEVVIDDDSISRAHATLKLGPPLTLVDMGSVNGTFVGERRLASGESATLSPGEVVYIGSVTLVLQRRSAPLRARRLWSHEYFELRLEEECARAARTGREFALVRLRVAGEQAATARERLAAVLRAADVAGEYGPNEYEVLLVEIDDDGVQPAVARLVEAMSGPGAIVRVGQARFPRDGRTTDELIATASPEEWAPAPSSGEAIEPSDGDRQMRELHYVTRRLAAGNISVLIMGETGVGKEVLAERIHRESSRPAGPYVRLNCAAFTETLLESELFGHEKGAFTGAIQAKPGLLETAEGGTVFLDEVGELPPSMQAKLLRVIEERAVRRVGGLKSRELDVRFISATNRNLEAEVERGHFRRDLYFRLNGATVVVPPLRERVTEIVELADRFSAAAAGVLGRTEPPRITSGVRALLLAYDWPGNIRELRNMMERAVLLCSGDFLTEAHLPMDKLRPTGVTRAPPIAPLPRRGKISEEEERERIEAALAASGGNQTRAAELLGISRRTLVSRLAELRDPAKT